MNLVYRSNICVGDLQVGECTVHRAGDASGRRWWLLWFRVNRDDNGQPFDACVPIDPYGHWNESGPGGKTWGIVPNDINPLTGGYVQSQTWVVGPSINVLVSVEIHGGEHPEASMWHHTPLVIGVPHDETWTNSPP